MLTAPFNCVVDVATKLSPAQTTRTETVVVKPPVAPQPVKIDAKTMAEIECEMQLYLSDVTLNLPIPASVIVTQVTKVLQQDVPVSAVYDLLEKFAAQQLVT